MVSVALTWTLLPPNRVVRTDGTLVKVVKQNSAKEEIHALLSTLKRREILLLIPMMFASNFFYPMPPSLPGTLGAGDTVSLPPVKTKRHQHSGKQPALPVHRDVKTHLLAHPLPPLPPQRRNFYIGRTVHLRQNCTCPDPS
ncbi:uncharacterized protein UTRI_02295 [Ustilago trichophora]|uniref:Uncharacterized protein n=1 Tax=Ustilago trichophora TaxID=86804 RepID=A0A5C3E8Y9_9BASI|nr:uncharacterized protein UTRI_02295 [Ustilago trichophora]